MCGVNNKEEIRKNKSGIASGDVLNCRGAHYAPYKSIAAGRCRKLRITN